MKKRLKIKPCLIALNLIFILGCIIFYGGRLIYYYKIENPNTKNIKTLKKLVLLEKNIVKSGDGLYKEKKGYYYKGKKINNYLKYSGRLFRIVSISNEGDIKLITEDSQTSLVWGYNQDYQNSYIKSWLNNDGNAVKSFKASLDNTSEILIPNKTCIDLIDASNITCKTIDNDYVGLLSVEEYDKAGDENSYLNIGKYFWTSNKDKNGNVWYIYSKGNVNNSSNSGLVHHSYGVRPTIMINGNISNFKGEGTKENPYEIIFETKETINKKHVGDYVNFSNLNWRIIEKNETTVKLVLDGLLKENNKTLLKPFGTTNYFTAKTGIGYYLNTTFYNSLSGKDKIIPSKFILGRYDKTNKYNFNKLNEYTEDANVGLLQLGELFVNDFENYYLSTRTITSDNTIYQVLEEGKIFVGSPNDKLGIRPTIYLNSNMKTIEGKGTKSNPYKVE
ncbi:MAG: hypothetical protein RRY22_01095 [Bacilli bacterium]